MDSETIDATVTTTVESPTPAEVDTGVLAAAAADDAADAELAKLLDDGDDIAASTAGGGLGVGEQGSGRLSSLVPTLGRFATRAHKASAPYLSYAAQASQEAARCVPKVLAVVGQVSFASEPRCSIDHHSNL